MCNLEITQSVLHVQYNEFVIDNITTGFDFIDTFTRDAILSNFEKIKTLIVFNKAIPWLCTYKNMIISHYINFVAKLVCQMTRKI